MAHPSHNLGSSALADSRRWGRRGVVREGWGERGLGSAQLGATGGGPSVVDQANTLIASMLDPATKAVIDSSPLSSAQRRELKTRPLSFFWVFVDFHEDLVIDFIRRVHRLTGKSSSGYMLAGGTRVTVAPSKSQDTAELVAQFLTVSHLHPVYSAQVSAQMSYELAAGTLHAIGQGLYTAGSDAVTAIQNAAQYASSWLPPSPFGALGEPGTAAAAGGGTAAAGGASTGGTLATVVGVATALAPFIVPILMKIIDKTFAITEAQIAPSAGAQGAAASNVYGGNLSPQARAYSEAMARGQSSDILGLPREVVIGGTGLAALAALAYYASRASR